MKNSAQNFPACSLLENSADRFYPARSNAVTAGHLDSWWARSYNQGLPAVGGRYVFLRGAWLPGNPATGYSASASWGACAPSTAEAC